MDCMDEQVLQELHEALGDDLFEITGFFIEQLETQVGRLVQCFDSEDLAALSRSAHALKGSAANMGAAAIADTAARIEKLALASDRPAAEPLVRSLPSLATETIAVFRASRFTAP